MDAAGSPRARFAERGSQMRFSSWRRVRGSYAVLSALSMTAILGFAAMSVDVSLMRLAQGHAQAVADAAALSALQILHETGDQTEAADAADTVTVLNPIVGSPGQISTILFGTWDPNGVGDKFNTNDPTKINAVRVTLNRTDVDLMFGRFFGALDFDVSAGSTTAAQTLQVILVTDITVSWDTHDFGFVRDASVNFLDYLYANHGPQDSVGHVVFFQQFGFIWTEMTNIDTAMTNPALVHTQWEGLNTGNTAGQAMPAWRDPVAFGIKHRDCKGFNTKAKHINTLPASACDPTCRTNPNQPLCDTCFGNDVRARTRRARATTATRWIRIARTRERRLDVRERSPGRLHMRPRHGRRRRRRRSVRLPVRRARRHRVQRVCRTTSPTRAAPISGRASRRPR